MPGSKPAEILIFEVAGQPFALPMSDVREVVRVVTIVPLPQAPASVEGVVNVRGEVVPVLDIRARFGLPPKPVEHTDHLIVANLHERRAALRVDRATDLVQLDPTQLEEVRRLAPGVDQIAWVAKLPDRLVLIHDLNAFLTAAESIALADVISRSSAAGEEA